MHTLCVKDRDDPPTEMIAKTIIKIAQTGVHDAAQLSALAIKELEIRRPALYATLASRVWNRNISQPDELAQRLRGFATREACYDRSISGRRVPYGRHHVDHFPDRDRSFHLDWNDLKELRALGSAQPMQSSTFPRI